MTEFSLLAGEATSNALSRARGASELIVAARSARSGQMLAMEAAGMSISGDRLAVTRSAGFAAEADAATAASGNATHAIALLDTAAAALAEIAEHLDRLAAIAEDAAAPELSGRERAQLDAAFQDLKEEIDGLAARASFGDASVLAGDGDGGPLRIEFHVGTGSAASDRVEIEISAAAVADLSASLQSADLHSADAAAQAAVAVAQASDAVATIQARVGGDRVRVGSAWLSARDAAAANESMRVRLSDPVAAVDLAHVVADQVADESDIPLAAGAEGHLRRLLAELSMSGVREEFPGATPAQRDGAGKMQDDLQPLTVEPAASRQGKP